MLALAQQSDLLQRHGTPPKMTRAPKRRTYFLLLLALASIANQMHAQPSAKPQLWIATWGTSQQIPESQNALPPDDLRDATVRQIVHLSVGGAQLRVHLSNAFGTEGLHIASAHIAR